MGDEGHDEKGQRAGEENHDVEEGREDVEVLYGDVAGEAEEEKQAQENRGDVSEAKRIRAHSEKREIRRVSTSPDGTHLRSFRGHPDPAWIGEHQDQHEGQAEAECLQEKQAVAVSPRRDGLVYQEQGPEKRKEGPW